MTRRKHETHAEEVVRVRSYLPSQAMRHMPPQLVESLREARRYLIGIAA